MGILALHDVMLDGAVEDIAVDKGVNVRPKLSAVFRGGGNRILVKLLVKESCGIDGFMILLGACQISGPSDLPK